mgnify:CR=1 FL=1
MSAQRNYMQNPTMSGIKDQTAQSHVSATGDEALRNLVDELSNKIHVLRIQGTTTDSKQITIARAYLTYFTKAENLTTQCVQDTARVALQLMDSEAEQSKADAYADYVANQEGEAL